MNYTIKNELYTVTVNSLGAEMISIKSAKHGELVWQNPENKFWKNHAPLLFPTCGRLKDARYSYGGKIYDMPSHGFIGKVEFKPKRVESNLIILETVSNDETKKIYPFDYIFTARYELIGEKIIFSVTIENCGKEILPYMFGWHPGFILPTDNEMDIEDYAFDFLGVDTLNWTKLQNGPFACPNAVPYALKDGKYTLCENEIYENDTMIFTGHKNEIVLSAEKSPYSIKMSWSENLPYLCIWKDPDNAAKYLCIEPWSNVPNNGVDDEVFETRKMTRLAPGKKDEYSYTLEF